MRFWPFVSDLVRLSAAMRLDSAMAHGLFGVVLLVSVACTRAHGDHEPLTPIDPFTLITPNVIGIMRSSGADSPLLSVSKDLYRSQCSEDLIGRIKNAYQLQTGGKNYFLFQGSVRREDVESCLGKVAEPKLEREDDLLVFEVSDAKRYAGWRGDVIVAGTKEEVTAALAQHDDALAKTWRERIGALPAGKFVMWTQQPVLTAFLGIPTSNFMVVASITGPHDGYAWFSADCADAAAAERGKQQLATGQVPPGIDPPPAIKAFLMNAKATVTGAHLEITVELGPSYTGDIDVPTLQAWAATWAQRANR